jgi:hypothetical protein
MQVVGVKVQFAQEPELAHLNQDLAVLDRALYQAVQLRRLLW